MTQTTGRRREQLAQFLRSRRARLSPGDVGLPEGIRRRTPGLRREEVAQLAGVGVTWYTWLEQGRPINASVQVLDAIARTLALDNAERVHLYRLADMPSVPQREAECLPPDIQLILDALTPLPAAVFNGRYDVLAWNAAYDALFPGLTHAPPDERNVVWQLFTVPSCCLAVGERESELRSKVAYLRANFGRHLGEPAWTSFVDRLAAASPEFASMWARHEVRTPAARVRFYVRNGGDNRLYLNATTLAIVTNPDVTMVAYTPVDEADRAVLAKLTATPPHRRRFCRAHTQDRDDHEVRGVDAPLIRCAPG